LLSTNAQNNQFHLCLYGGIDFEDKQEKGHLTRRFHHRFSAIYLQTNDQAYPPYSNVLEINYVISVFKRIYHATITNFANKKGEENNSKKGCP
jgi:hypothetical protein